MMTTSKLRIYCVLFGSMVSSACAIIPTYSTDLETELRTGLFTGYEVLQRPDKQVQVKVSITLLAVNELNIRDQSLSITAYFTVSWTDSRLSWSSNTTYTNVNFLFSTETYVWRPALILDNAVNDLTVMNDRNIPIRITPIGNLDWNPAGVYKVACNSDITYYPLDYQTCTLSVSSWGYTEGEIRLVYNTDHGQAVNIESYKENGEWEMMSQSTGTEGKSTSRGGQSFSNVKFNIVLRRRPLFHILNTIFPVVLMAFLSAMVFKLPPDSGEKIGFSLTVLLAYTVYLTLISHNIPSTSVSVCYLSIYLALILAYGTISVVCTILVLNVHHRSQEKEPVPRWLNTFAFSVLAYIVCWKGDCCCRKRRVGPSTQHVEERPTEVKRLQKDVSVHGSVISGDSDDMDDEDVGTWQDIAEILDKLFFIVFIAVIFLSTLTVFTPLLNNYNSS